MRAWRHSLTSSLYTYFVFDNYGSVLLIVAGGRSACPFASRATKRRCPIFGHRNTETAAAAETAERRRAAAAAAAATTTNAACVWVVVSGSTVACQTKHCEGCVHDVIPSKAGSKNNNNNNNNNNNSPTSEPPSS